MAATDLLEMFTTVLAETGRPIGSQAKNLFQTGALNYTWFATLSSTCRIRKTTQRVGFASHKKHLLPKRDLNAYPCDGRVLRGLLETGFDSTRALMSQQPSSESCVTIWL